MIVLINKLRNKSVLKTILVYNTYVRFFIFGSHNKRQTIDDGHNHPVSRCPAIFGVYGVVLVVSRIRCRPHQGLGTPEEPSHMLLDGIRVSRWRLILLNRGSRVKFATTNTGHLVHVLVFDHAGIFRNKRWF